MMEEGSGRSVFSYLLGAEKGAWENGTDGFMV